MLDSFASSSSQVTIKDNIPYKERYPHVDVDIKSFEINEIKSDSNICFLEDDFYLVVINDNINFVLEKPLSGIVQKGRFRLFYSRADRYGDRYIKLVMVEPIVGKGEE